MTQDSPRTDRPPRVKTFTELRKSLHHEAIPISSEALVESDCLQSGQLLPLVIKPRLRGVNLADWVHQNWTLLDASLMKHGGILFRGFDLDGLAGFREVVAATSVELMQYSESATPRTELIDKFYTSTEFPPKHNIALHNELTYVNTWPMKIWFFCATPPRSDGETPIADVRRVFNAIAPEIKGRFKEKGWMLVRNFGDGLGLPWQRSFHTSDRAEVEEYFRRAGIDYEWKDNGRLRSRQIRPAITRHPRTGESVWFNHIAFWHRSSLDSQLLQAMLTTLREEDLPYAVYYGDGSAIDDSVVQKLRESYQQETVVFPWHKGDLLMLDNMLVAHGRRAYEGDRRILVAMGEPFSRQGL